MTGARAIPTGPLRSLYPRYIAASAAALAVDLALFQAGLGAHVAPVLAAAAGYGAGIAAHWWLSSRAVFAARLADRGRGRRRQQALFLLSALAGLTITMALVGFGTLTGLDPRLAKLAAIALSFQATYLLRRRIVFA